MTSRWDSTTRPPTPIGRSAPETARTTRRPVSPHGMSATELVFRNDVPSRWRPGTTATRRFAGLRAQGPHAHDVVYAQDSWTIARRLTLNLGARYAHAVGFIPEQCRSASMLRSKPCRPRAVFPAHRVSNLEFTGARLGAAFDVLTARPSSRGGYGRFAHNWHSDELQMANENVHLRTLCTWHDANGNKLFDPGEINFDRNGPDFVSTSLFTGGEDGLAGAVPNPNLKEPMSDEFNVSVERQLIRDLALRVTGIYSRHDLPGAEQLCGLRRTTFPSRIRIRGPTTG